MTLSAKKIDKSIANHIVVVTYHLPTRWKLRTISRIDACIYGYLKSIANHIVVVTYHLPTRWKLRTISRIDACIYGYLHTNIDVEIGVTRINSDQIGYIFANDHLMN